MPKEQIVENGEIVDAEETEVEEVTDVEEEELTEVSEVEDDKPAVVEPWMAEGDEQLSDVPVSTHIRMKQKLKGRLSDQEDELKRLREENEKLKAGVVQPKHTIKPLPKRPKEEDFDTIVEYQNALDEFENDMIQIRLDTAENARQQRNAIAKAKATLDESVDSHYTRAAQLIEKSKIDASVYQQTDRAVRETVDAIIPGKGDLVVDQIISVLGEGSEKVLYYLGRNKKALDTFKEYLKSDGTGLKASVFLGQQKERLLNTKQKMSNARPPADDDIKGDSTISNKGAALLKKRKAALAKGNMQIAYDMKKAAKEQGIDVTNW